MTAPISPSAEVQAGLKALASVECGYYIDGKLHKLAPILQYIHNLEKDCTKWYVQAEVAKEQAHAFLAELNKSTSQPQ